MALELVIHNWFADIDGIELDEGEVYKYETKPYGTTRHGMVRDDLCIKKQGNVLYLDWDIEDGMLRAFYEIDTKSVVVYDLWLIKLKYIEKILRNTIFYFPVNFYIGIEAQSPCD